MRKYSLISHIVFLALALNACQSTQQKTTTTHYAPKVRQHGPVHKRNYTNAPHTNKTIQLASFTTLIINGHFDIIIKTGYKKHKIIVHGTEEAIKDVVSYVDNRALTLTTAHKHHTLSNRTEVTIYAKRLLFVDYLGSGNIRAENVDIPSLNIRHDTLGSVNISGKVGIHKLVLENSGSVNITGLSSNHLVLINHGNNLVRLKGTSNLKRLDFGGDGLVDLHWIDSPYIRITGHDTAVARLAGKVETLDVVLHNRAYMNARYLRANKAYVKTYDYARADLHVNKRLSTLAMGKSNIYYYQKAKMIAAYLGKSGAVLDMQQIR